MDTLINIDEYIKKHVAKEHKQNFRNWCKSWGYTDKTLFEWDRLAHLIPILNTW